MFTVKNISQTLVILIGKDTGLDCELYKLYAGHTVNVENITEQIANLSDPARLRVRIKEEELT